MKEILRATYRWQCEPIKSQLSAFWRRVEIAPASSVLIIFNTVRFCSVSRCPACDKLPTDTMIDGEVVAIDHDGQVSFNALQRSRGRIDTQLYVFDVLVHRGRNVVTGA